ncbi:MFS transporter, partial [Bacillus pseudomycoides]|nr:MFS transporter [Bacillus pseudomycoides]
IHVDQVEQEKILQITKEKIRNKSLESNAEKKQSEDNLGLNKEQKEKLIHETVNEAVKGGTVEKREGKREGITRQVTKGREEKEKSRKKDRLACANDVSQYTENKMEMRFKDLNKVSAPIILVYDEVSVLF